MLARDFDQAVDNLVARKRGVEFGARGLDLREAQPGEFLHRQVDLGGGYITLSAERVGVCHALNHKSCKGFSLIGRKPDLFQWFEFLPAHHIFFFNDTATTEIYTLSLHDALPTRARSRI